MQRAFSNLVNIGFDLPPVGFAQRYDADGAGTQGINQNMQPIFYKTCRDHTLFAVFLPVIFEHKGGAKIEI
ncbi:hypothetical protein [Thalassospira sp. NFXS8]|uniref:hypothetical protein n=1 Tax=Thalassospira sp. NFXS8 TaxID=2819093 RepID=UPI0032DEBB6B